MTSPRETVAGLLDAHGRTYASEIGIDIADRPSPLFRLLCATVLFAARINASLAVSAARALAEQGWTTPQKLAAASWSERVATLNQAGYGRYDESTSTQLGDTADRLLQRYDGDLRRLRAEAEQDPGRERALLKGFKGIGDVGVDIFFREVQGVWPELHPFADRRALSAAGGLGLPDGAAELAGLVDREDFPRLVTALVRVQLGEGDGAREATRPRSKQELYDRARQLDISGRSTMSKDELADAVERAEP